MPFGKCIAKLQKKMFGANLFVFFHNKDGSKLCICLYSRYLRIRSFCKC